MPVEPILAAMTAVAQAVTAAVEAAQDAAVRAMALAVIAVTRLFRHAIDCNWRTLRLAVLMIILLVGLAFLL